LAQSVKKLARKINKTIYISPNFAAVKKQAAWSYLLEQSSLF
jgi:hypothetical protein